MTQRKGNWLQTASGRRYYPLDPRSEDVDIGDIAHALGMQCRFGGHVQRFYSVAEHCVHVASLVPLEHGMCGLLHDATEAYIVDVPRPVKVELTNYKQIENLSWLAICRRFGLSPNMPACVKHADEAMLLVEQRELMQTVATEMLGAVGEIDVSHVNIYGWSPEQAAAQFMKAFHYYRERVHGL
jgi:uncharacterized protein